MVHFVATVLSGFCFLLVDAGKLTYYTNHAPQPIFSSEYWPSYDVLPSEAYDAVHYPAWFQLPWKPIPYLPWPAEVEPEPQSTPEIEPDPTTPVPVDDVVSTEDDTPEGRHLHHEKPHKHHHHHKHKHHKHKHHKHKHHHHHDINEATSDEETKTNDEEEEVEEIPVADVGQLKKVMLQLERKFQQLKLQLFGSRTLEPVDAEDDDEEDDTARFDVDVEEAKDFRGEKSQGPDEQDVTTPTSTGTDEDEGKALIEADADKPAAELELEHREVTENMFDNGRSLAENVQMWFEGLDLAKIAELPLEEPESADVLDKIDVRSGFEER
uniref:Uncharacterized protein n=1 Tax=Anopheles farauti TaxID=69004 RepID=A0A182QGW0_9DIPT